MKYMFFICFIGAVMQKNSVSFLKKSKALLGSSCFVLSLILLASSTDVLGSGRPPGGDRREEARARLAKKLRAKQLADVDKLSTRFDEFNFDSPHKELQTSILQFLESRVISGAEKDQIQQGFLDAFLDPAEVRKIQETFLTSFNSDLEYITTTSARLNSERDYFCALNPGFNIREAFATDLFQSTSMHRKDFILKVQPLVKVWIEPIKAFREKFSAENPENLACIVRMYYDLVSLAQVKWEGSNSALSLSNSLIRNPLLNKKARLLLSSIYDEGILEALETAQKLFPYVQVIQSTLNIPGLQQKTDHAEVIHQNVLKRLPKHKKGNLISPEALKQAHAKAGIRKDTDQSLEITVSNETSRIPSSSAIPSSSSIPSPLPAPTPLEIGHPIPFVEEEFSQASSSLEIPSSSPTLDLVDIQPEMPKIPSSMSLPLSSATSSSFDTFEHPLEQKWKRKDSPTKVRPTLDGEGREEAKFSLSGGAFKTFSRLLSKTYKGPIEKVVILFESLGGKVNEGRSGSRVKFELPHFLTQNTVMLDVFSPQDGDEATSQPTASPRKKSKSHRSKAARSKPSSSLTDLRKRQEVVLHSPHKHGSKKLAPYHVNDIRDMLLQAGFTEERVTRRES